MTRCASVRDLEKSWRDTVKTTALLEVSPVSFLVTIVICGSILVCYWSKGFVEATRLANQRGAKCHTAFVILNILHE